MVMADPHIQLQTDPPSAQAPLLNANQNHNQHPQQQQQQQNQIPETDLDRTLQKLETYLTFLGFNQSSVLRFVLSWTAFVIIGVLVPVVILELSHCPGCEKGQIKDFELDIVASQACLAAFSLICMSHNLRKYGIRKFLFVDRHSGHMARFHYQYIQQIKALSKRHLGEWFFKQPLRQRDSLRLLIFWSLPCFILKTAREIIRILYVHHESWWQSTAILFALILSWTYLSTLSLSASILFHVVCNLQVIHFDDYAKLLERESDVLVLIEEHMRLRYHLSKISHRFRIYLLLEFLVVTASQFLTLFQTTGYGGIITFINGGDFAVSSIVQVVGIILCLHAATKISHRAQNIASIASRWHALATCSSTEPSRLRVSNSAGNLEASSPLNSVYRNYSESDLDSLDYVAMPTNTQLASYMSSYHRRQAYVMYLQANPGGITIFGWTVDRALINTIFFIELSLVTFVLGKTIVL